MQDHFSPSLELAVLQSRTLPQLVQQDIERLILSGQLQAGERLNEVAISRRLGVSRGPIREALRTLEEAGLLRFEKMRGMAVREITPEEAGDIYQLRACLEALICERAATRMSAEQLKSLSALVREMDDAAAASDVERYHRLNVRFHEELVAIADSREFARFYQAVVKKLTLFRQRTLAQGDAIAVSNREHHAILRHLAAGDAKAAARAMQKHIQASSGRMQKALRAFHKSKAANQNAAHQEERAGIAPVGSLARARSAAL
jgi:phosphonate utilization transcriptional regulator